jgi:ribosomal protein L44E
MDDKFVKKLFANMKCGVCGQSYESTNVNVLGHREDLWFLSVYCPACKSQGLVAAVIKEGKLPEVITELSEAERAKFSAASSVDSDDVLDMHIFLEKFSGDFSSLFPEK